MKFTIVYLLPVLFFPFTALAQANLRADFRADKTTACSSVLVRFINLSSGNGPLSFYWDLGNGNFSEQENPYASYLGAGEYTVKLIVRNATGSDTLVRKHYITIHEPTAPSFTIHSDKSGCRPHTIRVAGITAINPDKVASWEWDFGDGLLGSGQTADHVYKTAGKYYIHVSMVDDKGCRSTSVRIDSVEVRGGASVGFDANDTFSCEGKARTTFINLSDGDGPLSFHWDFGDGKSAGEISPVHSYESPGVYNVELQARDVFGCTAELVKKQYVRVISTTSAFTTMRDTFCVGAPVSFKNQSVSANRFFWSFGDGDTSLQRSPSHVYSSAGSYQIKLISSYDGQCAALCEKSIVVQKPQAAFYTSEHYSCVVPFDVQYVNISKGGVAYEWRLGGMKDPSFEAAPQVTYLRSGSFNDTLIATDAKGCRDTMAVRSNVVVKELDIMFSPNDENRYRQQITGCVPLDVNFQLINEYDNSHDSLVKYNWIYGDGDVASVRQQPHRYEQPGEFLVELAVETAGGCRDTFSATVQSGTRLSPNFRHLGGDSLCSGGVQFLDESADNGLIDSWRWIFGDNTWSNLKNPVHDFQDTGWMDVSLTLAYNGCQGDPLVKEKLLYVKGPAVDFVPHYSCNDPLSYYFEGRIKGADRFYWDFGDQSPLDSLHRGPSHRFASSANYFTSLTAYNDQYGCADQTIRWISPRKPEAAFTMDAEVGCVGSQITFDASGSLHRSGFHYKGQQHLYLWKFGDDDSSVFTDEVQVSHTFRKKGAHDVSLVIRGNNGCYDTIVHPVRIFEPDADFFIDTLAGSKCLPVTIKFEDASEGDTSLVNYQWRFSNGATDTGSSIQFRFMQEGVYSVSLEVTDAMGCSAVKLKEDVLAFKIPKAVFFLDDSTLCKGAVLHCLDQSIGSDLSYKWDFGDGAVNHHRLPLHAYTDTGAFEVQLVVRDRFGCEDSAAITTRVQDHPVSSFDCSQTFSNCYPFEVNFYNNSISRYALRSRWNFGDGTAGSEQNEPTYRFVRPGLYDVSLVSTTGYGCADTLVMEGLIDIRGPYARIDAPDTVCLGDTAVFQLTDQKNIHSFVWDFGDGVLDSAENTGHVYGLMGTLYPSLYLFQDTLHTCDKFFSDTIVVPELLARFRPVEIEGCVPHLFSPQNSSYGSSHYIWDFNTGTPSYEAQPSHIFTKSGVYSVTLVAINGFGCSDSAQTIVTVHPLPELDARGDTLICAGSNILLDASGGESYRWYRRLGNERVPVQDIRVTPLETSRYIVEGTDRHSCQNLDSFMVYVQQPPELIVSPDTVIIIGDTAALSAISEEGALFRWVPANYLPGSDTIGQRYFYQPMEQLSVRVSATDSNHCFTTEKEILVAVREAYTVRLPDYFTPNGDGVNDVIFVKGWGIKELIRFSVFNRWGEIVYSSSDVLQGWDGRYKGTIQGVGTYTYLVEVLNFENKIISVAGSFDLLK